MCTVCAKEKVENGALSIPHGCNENEPMKLSNAKPRNQTVDHVISPVTANLRPGSHDWLRHPLCFVSFSLLGQLAGQAPSTPEQERNARRRTRRPRRPRGKNPKGDDSHVCELTKWCGTPRWWCCWKKGTKKKENSLREGKFHKHHVDQC